MKEHKIGAPRIFYTDRVGLLDVTIWCKAMSAESTIQIQVKLDDFKETVVECKDGTSTSRKLGNTILHSLGTTLSN